MKVLWPFGVALRWEVPNHPELRRLNSAVVSVRGKGAGQASGGDREDDRCGNIEMVLDDVETGALVIAPGQARRVPAGWPGGVRCRGGVSPVCGSRTERGKACPDIAASARGDRESRRSGRSPAGGVRVPSRDTPADRLVVVMKPV